VSEQQSNVKELLYRLDNSRDINDRLQLLSKIASQQWSEGNYREGLKYAELARSLAESIDDPEQLADAHYYLGLNYNYLNEYGKSLDHYLECLKLCREIDNSSILGDCLNNIGTVYVTMQDYDSALSYFQQALQYEVNPARVCNNISAVYTAREEYDKALEYSLKAYEYAPADDRAIKGRSKVISLLNIAVAYMNLEDHRQALNYLKKAVEVADRRNDDTVYLAHQKLGSFLIEHNIDEAYEHLKRALDYAEKSENTEHKLGVFASLADYYQQKGAYKESNEYLNKYVELKEKLLNDRMMDRMAKLLLEHKNEVENIKYEGLLEKTARLTSITAITSGIVHEIYQPLSAIALNVENSLFCMNRTNGTSHDDAVEFLHSIKNSVQHINEIITQMKNFYRSQESRQSERVDIKAAINKCIQCVRHKIYSAGVICDLNLPEEDIFIDFVPTYLEQIIIILIINALQALSTMQDNRKSIEIGLQESFDRVHLTVQDNGPGIPEDNLARIFEPFYSTKPLTQEQGTGLGLTIVKTFVERYDGSIEVSNLEPHGAKFVLTFKKQDREKE